MHYLNCYKISYKKDIKNVEKCDCQKYVLLLACDIDRLNDVKKIVYLQCLIVISTAHSKKFNYFLDTTTFSIKDTHSSILFSKNFFFFKTNYFQIN